MAGKTFPGIGDQEEASPQVDPADADADDSGSAESRPFYSGPTVVDDLKVEEGLKKLRSLDAPLGPLTGITKAVADAIETGPTRTTTPMAVDLSQLTPAPAKVVPEHLRETAVGRNVIGPTVGQQEIPPPFDDRALRGTLFGHSIHAPEFALPAPEEPPPAGALALANRGAPTKTVIIYHPDHPPLPIEDGAPFEPEPFQRPNRHRNTPLTPMGVSQSSSRKKVFTRVAIGAAGILAIVAAALFWARPGDDSDGSAAAAAAAAAAANRAPAATPPVVAPPATATPAATAPPVAAPPVTAPPAPVAREPDPEPMPAATPPAHPSPAVARPVTRHAADPAEPGAESAGADAHAHHTHSGGSHSDRRHPALQTDKGDKSDTDAPPAKAHKRANEDDPDATMAPSIE